MSPDNQKKLAIACSSGSFKGAFAHGSDNYKGANIHTIQPDVDPKELGVDFTDATVEGLVAVYRHGEEKGKEFIASVMDCGYSAFQRRGF